MYGTGSRPPLTTRHRTTAYGASYGSDPKAGHGPESENRRRGRNSLSALDEKRAEAMRIGVLAYMTRNGAEPPQAQHANPTVPIDAPSGSNYNHESSAIV